MTELILPFSLYNGGTSISGFFTTILSDFLNKLDDFFFFIKLLNYQAKSLLIRVVDIDSNWVIIDHILFNLHWDGVKYLDPFKIFYWCLNLHILV